MTTAAWAFLSIALIGLIGLCVLVSLGVLKAIPRAFDALDSMQARHSQHMDQLLNRLMAIRWEDYVQVRDLEEPEYGGFQTPEEQRESGDEPVMVEGPRGWGTMSRRRENLEALANEETLVMEDFGADR